MTAVTNNQRFEQLVRKIEPQSKLLRAWELKGGVSAQVTALEIEQPARQTKRMIVRQHGPVDLKNNPQIAADEFKLLQILQSAGLATPAPYYLDQSGNIFPTPYIVIEYVDGASEFALAPEHMYQLATQLASIHALDCSTLDVSFLPQQAQRFSKKVSERPAKLDESLDEGRIRDTLESVWPLSLQNPAGLLHGDFWPGNILWKHGQLVAVIDWEDAAVGDPLADVASARLEILWAFGIDAMQHFTQHYQSMTSIDFTNLPIWDLFAALRPASKLSEWAADEIAEQRMRVGHKLFVAQAFEKLSDVKIAPRTAN
jgi:aminoglycoside phosphotransferase (APT) family kinase protein